MLQFDKHEQKPMTSSDPVGIVLLWLKKRAGNVQNIKQRYLYFFAVRFWWSRTHIEY